MADERVTVKDNFGSDITGKVIEKDILGKPTKIQKDFGGGTYKKDSFGDTYRQEK
jgi:hypothetical protein